ncbi:MAG TPA: hypothetical protein VMP68_17335 [Candidatus Eisenbacteria bacterium]|nr:hypothetical protein [Candidatus Eisenbacteria bacterium]
MLIDFLRFLLAIWGEWQTLLTGGSVIAIAWMIEIVRDKPNPRNVNWLIVAVTFIFAAFLAWRRERKLSEALKGARLEVLKLITTNHHQKVADLCQQTGANFDLLVQMQAAGELYIQNDWVFRENPASNRR